MAIDHYNEINSWSDLLTFDTNVDMFSINDPMGLYAPPTSLSTTDGHDDSNEVGIPGAPFQAPSMEQTDDTFGHNVFQSGDLSAHKDQAFEGHPTIGGLPVPSYTDSPQHQTPPFGPSYQQNLQTDIEVLRSPGQASFNHFNQPFNTHNATLPPPHSANWYRDAFQNGHPNRVSHPLQTSARQGGDVIPFRSQASGSGLGSIQNHTTGAPQYVGNVWTPPETHRDGYSAGGGIRNIVLGAAGPGSGYLTQAGRSQQPANNQRWYVSKLGSLLLRNIPDSTMPNERLIVEFLEITTNSWPEHQYQPPYAFEYLHVLPHEAPKSGIIQGYLDAGEYRLSFINGGEVVTFHISELVNRFIQAFRAGDAKKFDPELMLASNGENTLVSPDPDNC